MAAGAIVSVVIPTLSRHRPLQRAIRSVLEQKGLPDYSLEVIVVDNSPGGDARATVEALKSSHGPLVHLISEPFPGVARARNAGVRSARGKWIAFLDDDEEASDFWLASLIAVARDTQAEAIFGPIEARADGAESMGVFERYFARLIDRPDRSDITDLAAYLGTNNSMFNRELCLSGDCCFEASLDSTGGEDSLLLKQLVLRNRRFAWARGAKVIEWVPVRRLSWSYVRRRKFLSGQIRVFVHRMVEPVQWSQIGFWMAVGLIQVAAGAGAATVLLLFNRHAAQRALVVLSAGLGKLFWTPRFRPILYGAGHYS